MSGMTAVDKPDLVPTLPGSLNSRRRLTVTLESAHGWQTFKGVFLSSCEESRTFRASVQSACDAHPTTDVRSGDSVGVSYRVGNRKCMFCSPLVSLTWNGEGGETVLGWPVKIEHLRRRAFERAAPPSGQVITVRLTGEAGHASPGAPLEVHNGRLLDISVGGFRLAVADARGFNPGTTYRCSFTARRNRSAIVFDAIVLHRGLSETGKPNVGLKIVGLETALDSSQTLDRLTRVVTYFQRAASRRR